MNEILKAGAIRLRIYVFVTKIVGRNLTKEEHEGLKVLLKDFRKTVAPIQQPEATEHTYTCVSCGGKKVGYGKRFKNKMRKIKPPRE